MNASARSASIAASIAFALTGCSRADLSIDPPVLSGCALGHGSPVTVRWDASKVETDAIRLYITRPGEGDRRWLQGAPTGSRKTGRWATDGITFVLRDSKERELARRTLETSPCPLKQKEE